MSPDEKQMLSALFARVKQASTGPRDADAERLINDEVKANPAAPYLLAQAVLVQEQALTAANARILELEQRAADLERQAQEKGSGGLFGGLFSKPSAPADNRPRSGVPGVGGGMGAGAMGAGAMGAGMGPGGQPGYGPNGGYGGGYPGPGPQQGPMGGMGGAGPWGGGGPQQQGGGFLRGALTTAAGVAGGALLFQGISSMFSGSQAHASGLGNIAAGTPQAAPTSFDEAAPAAPEAAPVSYDEPYDAGGASYDNASYDDGGFDSGGGDDWA